MNIREAQEIAVAEGVIRDDEDVIAVPIQMIHNGLWQRDAARLAFFDELARRKQRQRRLP